MVSAELNTITQSHIWPLIARLVHIHCSTHPPVTCKKEGDEVGGHLNPTGRGVGRHCQGESDWHLKEHRRQGGERSPSFTLLKDPCSFEALLLWGCCAQRGSISFLVASVTRRASSSFLFCVGVPYPLPGNRKMRPTGLGCLSPGDRCAFGDLLCSSIHVGGRHLISNQVQKVPQLPDVIPPSD